MAMRRPFTVLYLAILLLYGCRSGALGPISRMADGTLVGGLFGEQ